MAIILFVRFQLKDRDFASGALFVRVVARIDFYSLVPALFFLFAGNLPRGAMSGLAV